jgi:hypothetical protein
MKPIAKIFFLASLLVMALVGCEKDENQIFFEGGTAPVFSSTVANNSTLPLAFADKDKEMMKLSWTNPNYKFTTGLSSQDVNYTIEIDTTGANFTNPKKKSIAISKDLSLSITVGDFNDYLLNVLELNTTMNHNVELRVKATLTGNSSVPVLYSNTLKYAIKPYAIPPKVTPPSSNKLFIVGDATPGGWNNPVPTPSQEFTTVSPTLYQINSIALTGGKSYLLLPVNGDWSVKFGAIGANNSNNPDADDFRNGGGDMLAPAASGNYKIVVNFQTGRFTLTKL